MADSEKSDGRIFQDFCMALFSKSDGKCQLVWQNALAYAIFCQDIWQNYMKVMA